eukprot:1156503-Pelagomonas_calceolata.AAC.9
MLWHAAMLHLCIISQKSARVLTCGALQGCCGVWCCRDAATPLFLCLVGMLSCVGCIEFLASVVAPDNLKVTVELA